MEDVNALHAPAPASAPQAHGEHPSCAQRLLDDNAKLRPGLRGRATRLRSGLRGRAARWKASCLRSAHEVEAGADHDALLRKRVMVVAGLIALTAGLVALCVLYGPQLFAFVSDAQRFRAWVDDAGAASRVAFVAMNAAQVLFAFLPGEPLELAAGYAFGFWEGTLWCLTASAVGTAAIMLLVRRFGTRIVGLFFPPEKIASVRWLRDARRFELVLFLVFLIPGTPKDLLTYAAGLGTSPVGRIVAITTVGRIPSIISSTLAAGAFGDGNYVGAAVVGAATLVLAGAGVLAYRKLSVREQGRAA